MLLDGVGITTKDGLMQTVKRIGHPGVRQYYRGATLYNSGEQPAGWNLGKGRLNPCYASDFANRLMGWAADSSPCNKGTVGSV